MLLRTLLPLDYSDEVVVAQVEAFKRRVPILYAILGVNTVAMIATHWGQGTPLFTVAFPTLFLIIMLVRATKWQFAKAKTFDTTQSRDIIRATTLRAVILAAAMLFWACYMYNVPVIPVLHGITGFGHTVLYISLTVICCMSLLMHVRVAAISVTTIVMTPFCFFLVWQGSIVEMAVALNIGLVTLGMLYVVMIFSKDFETLVTSSEEVRLGGQHNAMLAITDTLTGLTNRRHLFNVLEERCYTRQPFSLFIIDLDGFKQINDLYGHTAGDEVLRQTGERIAMAYGEHLSLSRIGGDEFAIICGVLEPTLIAAKAKRVIEACQQPIFIERALVSVGASIGAITVREGDFHLAPTKHIERADFALSHAKQNGKGRLSLFNVEHEARIRREVLVEQTLSQADLATELTVYYQPVVCTISRRLLGFEALARWKSPTLGDVSPAEFVPLAERSEVIHRITRHILATALEQSSQWTSDVRLKVNLSGKDILNDIQMLEIMSILGRSQGASQRLTFELTETAVVKDFSSVMASIAMIRATGVSFAIDDFGTGYSSLGYVHSLSPDLIKIDRSFVSRIGSGDNVESIIKTIVELCRNIGARSLAEGVETEAQAKILQSLGVEELQGYLIAKPMQADDLRAFLSLSVDCH